MMGYTVNHWIMVHGCDATARGTRPEGIPGFGSSRPVAWAHEVATKIFPPQQVSPLLLSSMNHTDYISICPDGSNEGWDMSNDFDRRRAQFIASLVVGRVKLDHIMSWTMFGLGEDGDRKTATIMEYHDSIFYALCEGEPVLSERMGHIEESEVFAALDLILPGEAGEQWRRGVQAVLATHKERIPYLLAAETMVLGKLLDLPDKYGAIGTPHKLPTKYRARGSLDALPIYAVEFYDQLLADAAKHFPGVHPSVL